MRNLTSDAQKYQYLKVLSAESYPLLTLQDIDPKSYRDLFGLDMSSEVFTDLLTCARQYAVEEGYYLHTSIEIISNCFHSKLDQALNILTHLASVERFDMLLMFLSSKERNGTFAVVMCYIQTHTFHATHTHPHTHSLTYQLPNSFTLTLPCTHTHTHFHLTLPITQRDCEIKLLIQLTVVELIVDVFQRIVRSAEHENFAVIENIRHQYGLENM